MSSKPKKEEKTRFDTRLSKEQKALFEKAAQIGGYKNLSDFVLWTVQERAVQLINENEQILSSQNDRAMFFDAMVNPNEPNEKLKQALDAYNQILS